MSTLNVDDINLGGRTNNFRGADIASAATTDISAATGDLVHITGTTTITSFGTAPQAGVKRNVIFDGALVLTNGANLSLPGGVDITTVAGDSAVFISNSTTAWKCISYSSNSPLKAADIASSGTTSIAEYPGDLIHVTGTTTITSLGSAPQAGVQKTVIFDGILTLTNGASLSLPGGVNILTAANDSAVFISDSTTAWKCVQYTRAAIEVLKGTYLATRVIAASGTYTPTSGARSALVRMFGGGGAGGSASAVIGAGNGGGGSGGYAEYALSSISGTYSVTIGAAGVAAAAAVGGNGGNTIFVDGATTVTAYGGSGGAFAAGTAAAKYINGGAGGIVSTFGTVNAAGVSGDAGAVSAAGTIGKAGNGGSTSLGGGGQGGVFSSTAAVGGTAVLNTGSGGGGGGTGLATAALGGNGALGIIIITEYR
jgi:uncharacterized cupin superfamily protein